MSDIETPIRILHVIGLLDRGGTETGLMHILRHIDRDRFKLDFLTHTTRPGAYDDEAQQLGARVIPCLAPRQPFQYARNFQRIMRKYGPYDIVHSHSSHFSGFVQRLAYKAGTPVRISHSRNCFDQDAHRLPRPIQDAYLALTKYWLEKYTTLGLAVSEAAAAYLFGESWDKDPRIQVMYSGNDFSGFETTYDRDATRRGLGIPEGAFVIGHVGSFNWVKNHTFLVEVAAEAHKREPATWLLMVGQGELKDQVVAQVREAGLDAQTVFAGVRDDIPQIMQAMDMLVFPSYREGLPRVIVEAQAAGLPCLLSDTITPEVIVIEPLITRISLDQPPSDWAEVAIQRRDQMPVISQAAAHRLMVESTFNIEQQVQRLERVYLEQVALHARTSASPAR